MDQHLNHMNEGGGQSGEITLNWSASQTQSRFLLFSGDEQMFGTFSGARPVVWAVGNALLTGTLWVDVMTAARISTARGGRGVLASGYTLT